MILDIVSGSVIIPIFLGISAIIISILFFYITSGFMNETAVLRLTKASFRLDLLNVINLWTTYFILSFMIYFIYIYAPQTLNHSAISEGLPTVTVFIVLFIIYLGRVFTRFDGIDSGKAYFTTIVTFGLIRLFINYGTTSSLAINIANASPKSLDYTSYYFAEINKIMFSTHNIMLLIIGTLLLSTIGEFLLSLIPSTSSKAYISLMESIINPPRGEILDSPKEIKNKFKEILIQEEIQVIKCVTRSLWVVEMILEIDAAYSLKLEKSHIKVIEMPERLTKESILKDIFNRPPSLDIILDRRNEEFDLFWDTYAKRRSYVSTKSEIRTSNIGNLRFVIVEYSNGDRCMIHLARDIGASGTTIGLYSDWFQDVEKYSRMFDETWEAG